MKTVNLIRPIFSISLLYDIYYGSKIYIEKKLCYMLFLHRFNYIS